MAKTQVVIITLVAYKMVLIAIGFWASKRTSNADDFLLAGRGLGPVVAAISYSSSASSAWTLLGLSGVAYVVGLSSLWIVMGSVCGMLVAWYWMAPRLMSCSRANNQITLTDFLLQGLSGHFRQLILWIISLIIIFSFVFYIAAQFQGAGSTFSSAFDLSINKSIIIGASIIMFYTLLGGFWAVSVTDTIQGILMALTAILLPIAALLEVGGISGFIEGLKQVSSPEQLSFTAANTGFYMLGVVLGGMAIGIGTFGQPHLLVRFMALRDHRALRQARLITTLWYLVVFLGMWFLGLVGHILHAGIANPESIFFVLTESLFSPLIGAILLAAVLAAIMSTADSQLLVAAGAIAYDLGFGKGKRDRLLLVSRLAVVVLVILSIAVAIYMPEKIFNRVLFAWIALGSAFGPLVLVRLASLSVKPVGVLLSISSGFLLSVGFYLTANSHPVIERLAPFCIAACLLLLFKDKSQLEP